MLSDASCSDSDPSLSGRRSTTAKAKGVALAGFILCLLGFALGPEVLKQMYGKFQERPTTLRYTVTVRFTAMPAAYLGRAEFDTVTADGNARLHCVRQPAERSVRIYPYHCNVTWLLFSTATTDLDYFPVVQGWQKHGSQVQGAMDVDVPDEDDWWIEGLFAMLAAGLYWQFRPSTQGVRHVALLPALGWCAVVLFATTLIGSVLELWGSIADEAFTRSLAADIRHQPWPTLATIVVTGPVLEELVFRGIGWRVLESAFPPLLVGLLTSAVFTALHGYSWAGNLAVFASGLGFALIRIKTGSVGWCMFTHAITNALALAVIHYNL